MELNIISRGVELTPELKGYIERKLGHFDSKLGNIMETRIEVVEEPTRSAQDRTIVRISISGADIVLHSEERADNLRTAVDRVEGAVTKQIERQKGKWQDKGKAGPSIRTEATTAAPAARQRKITETRSIKVKPMSLGEALSQIELLGYDLLLFQNTDTKAINLLKRRPDGNYDLIRSEPE